MTNVRVEGQKAPDKLTDRHRLTAWISKSPPGGKLVSAKGTAALPTRKRSPVGVVEQ